MKELETNESALIKEMKPTTTTGLWTNETPNTRDNMNLQT